MATRIWKTDWKASTLKKTLTGKEHDYRITMNDCKYSVEQDGILVAEIQYDETWKQISGEPLSDEIVESIGHAIVA